MVTSNARAYTEEDWKSAKKRVEQTTQTVAKFVDDAKESALASRHFERKNSEINLASVSLWNIPEGNWQGPWNLSYPGEIQRYLQKKDGEGNTIFALEPPSQITSPSADPQRSGRRRRHRGRRRPG